MVALNTDPERWTSSETYMITEIHGMGVAEVFKVMLTVLDANEWTLKDVAENQCKIAVGVVKHAMEAFLIGSGQIVQPDKTVLEKKDAMLEPYRILGKSIAMALVEEKANSNTN